MIKLKIIGIKHHFKNGNYRIIGQNLFTKSIKYYSLEDCKMELSEGDLIICESLRSNIKINGHINQGILIPRIKFIKKELIAELDYFEQLANGSMEPSKNIKLIE